MAAALCIGARHGCHSPGASAHVPGTQACAPGARTYPEHLPQPPFHPTRPPPQIIYLVTQQRFRPPLPPDCPPRLAALIRRCWAHDPEERCAGRGAAPL